MKLDSTEDGLLLSFCYGCCKVDTRLLRFVWCIKLQDQTAVDDEATKKKIKELADTKVFLSRVIKAKALIRDNS